MAAPILKKEQIADLPIDKVVGLQSVLDNINTGSGTTAATVIEYDESINDYSTLLQNALDSGGTVVLQQNQEYPVNSRVELNVSGTTLDLNGATITSATNFRFFNINELGVSDFVFNIKNGSITSTLDTGSTTRDLFGLITMDNESISKGVFESLILSAPDANTNAIKGIAQVNGTTFGNIIFDNITVDGIGSMGIEMIANTATYDETDYNEYITITNFESRNTGLKDTKGQGISVVTNTQTLNIDGFLIDSFDGIGLEVGAKYANVKNGTIKNPRGLTAEFIYSFVRNTQNLDDTSVTNVVFDGISMEGTQGRVNIINRSGRTKVINSFVKGNIGVLGEGVDYVNSNFSTQGNIEANTDQEVTFIGGRINFEGIAGFQVQNGTVNLKEGVEVTRISSDGSVNDGQMAFLSSAASTLNATNVTFNDGYLNASQPGTYNLKDVTYNRSSGNANIFLGSAVYNRDNVTINGVKGYQLDASGFGTNLTTSDDTFQKVADKVNVLSIGQNGTDGESAYEIALLNGFQGTEAEWLTSLQGQDGTSDITPKWSILTSDYTLQATDMGKQFVNLTDNFVELTIPTELSASFGADFARLLAQEGIGKIGIKGANGVSCRNLRTTGPNTAFSILRRGDDNFVSYSGGSESYVPQNPELYNLSNAAGDDSDSTNGWVANGNVTVESVADSEGSSSNSILITRLSGGGFTNGGTTLTGLTDGATYDVVVRARKGVSNAGNPVLQIWDSGPSGTESPNSTTISSDTYTDYNITVTMGGATDLVMYFYPIDASTVGEELFISNISVIEQ